ncbi:MAG TPA: hypothetical protein VFQ54_01600 [Thermomicrobiales bacterium]|nr:hypothetical protein [Thermomicrobiales bacterium]
MQQLYRTSKPTRTYRPVQKPARDAGERAVRSAIAALEEEVEMVYDQLYDAMRSRKSKTSHHHLDHLLALGDRYDELQADLQAMAGEGSQANPVAA